MLAEAGAHTRAAEQELQVARQTLGGMEASGTGGDAHCTPLHFLFRGYWCHGPPEVLAPHDT